MKKSSYIALIIALIAFLWVLSGVLSGSDERSPQSKGEIGEPAQSELQKDNKITEVRVEDLSAQAMKNKVEVTGRTQAARQVIIKAEIEGQIASLKVKKGDRVVKNQLLAKMETRDRGAQVTQAQQLVKQREIQYNAAKELSERGFNSRVRLEESKAELEQAKAQLQQARVTLSNINVKAPFSGVINQQMVELGDYVSVGNDLFDIVDLSPIEITAFLTEQQIIHAQEGQMAKARLSDGQQVEGVITFIASAANPETRTFEMEMTVENPMNKIKEGLTAQIDIPTEATSAYMVSPSILSLADNGSVGVKLVNSDDIVEFRTVRLLQDTPTHIWIGDLPDNIRLITVGQEFVVKGQKVKSVKAETEGQMQP